MKISKIAKLCKEEKRICTTDTEVGVWIGNGYCVYLLPEFKYLEQDGIALAFGISAKDKSKIFFHKVPLTTLCLEDFDESETICEQMDFSFSTNKGTVQAYKTQEGVLFLRTDMLAPLCRCVMHMIKIITFPLAGWIVLLYCCSYALSGLIVLPYRYRRCTFVPKMPHRLCALLPSVPAGIVTFCHMFFILCMQNPAFPLRQNLKNLTREDPRFCLKGLRSIRRFYLPRFFERGVSCRFV